MTILDSRAIQEILPHRYPFLLVDKIIELEPRTRIVGVKQVTINEYFFRGHFPEAPVMPGVLIIEALAQVGAILALREFADRDQKIPFFSGIESARFRRPVVPGDGCAGNGSSVTGLAFYGDGNYPADYRGALFFGDYARGCIWVIRAGPNGDPDPATVTLFRGGATGPIDLRIGPGGDDVGHAVPLADEAVAAVAGLDQRHLAGARRPFGESPLSLDEFLFTARLHAEPDDIVCGHLSVLPFGWPPERRAHAGTPAGGQALTWPGPSRRRAPS